MFRGVKFIFIVEQNLDWDMRRNVLRDNEHSNMYIKYKL